MTRIFAAIAALLLAFAGLAAGTAEAGCHGGGYRMARHYQSHRIAKRRVVIVRRETPRPRLAKRTSVAATEVAEAQPQEEAAPAAAEPASEVAQSENSTIATTARRVAAKDVDDKPVQRLAAAKEVGCKQFFPAVGMTLSVRCE